MECSCSFCGAKRWNATLQLVLGAVNSIVGNAGYAATAVSYRAYVFDRIVDIAEEPWA